MTSSFLKLSMLPNNGAAGGLSCTRTCKQDKTVWYKWCLESMWDSYWTQELVLTDYLVLELHTHLQAWQNDGFLYMMQTMSWINLRFLVELGSSSQCTLNPWQRTVGIEQQTPNCRAIKKQLRSSVPFKHFGKPCFYVTPQSGIFRNCVVIYYFLLPNPAGRPPGIWCYVIAVICEEAFALTQGNLSVIAN